MDDGDIFDPEEDSDPPEEDADELGGAFEGVDDVPPSSSSFPSSSMALPGAPLPARPCTSFADLYARYAGFVRKKLSRRDIAPEAADELHQDIFLTVHAQFKEIGLLKSPEAMLSTITKYAIGNHRRRRGRLPQFDAEVEADEIPASRSDVEQRVIDAENKRILESLLDKLSGEDGALITLIDIDGMTPEQAAWFFNRPLATIRTQHRRAREKLRALAERLQHRIPDPRHPFDPLERDLSGGEGALVELVSHLLQKLCDVGHPHALVAPRDWLDAFRQATVRSVPQVLREFRRITARAERAPRSIDRRVDAVRPLDPRHDADVLRAGDVGGLAARPDLAGLEEVQDRLLEEADRRRLGLRPREVDARQRRVLRYPVERPERLLRDHHDREALQLGADLGLSALARRRLRGRRLGIRPGQRHLLVIVIKLLFGRLLDRRMDLEPPGVEGAARALGGSGMRLRAYPGRAPVAGRPICGASRRCSSSAYKSRPSSSRLALLAARPASSVRPTGIGSKAGAWARRSTCRRRP